MRDEQISIDITLFSRRAVARCWAPTSPIWLPRRSSDVSVCVAEWVVGDEGRVDLDRHHLVLSQSSGEMLGSHIPDLIRAEVE